MDRIDELAFSDFPADLLPKGDVELVAQRDYPDFGVGGIDGQGRLVSFEDDGTILALQLDEATVRDNRIRAPTDVLATRAFPEEYMVDRDTSGWRWVHPRYRWLTEGSE